MDNAPSETTPTGCSRPPRRRHYAASPRSLRYWNALGLLDAEKTPGGPQALPGVRSALSAAGPREAAA